MTQDHTRCRHCGARHDQHGLAENPHRPFACPKGDGRTFPKFPATVERKRGMADAQKVWARRLELYWTARHTSFQAGV
jgi:hypothetical protein